jgi:hypothetical protein
MEDVDGTQITIDNSAGFLTARFCVGLSLRRHLLAAAAYWDDMD